MRADQKMIKWDSTEGGSSSGFGESLDSGSNDIVVVQQSNGELAATPVHLQIGENQFLKYSLTPIDADLNNEKTSSQLIIYLKLFMPDTNLNRYQILVVILANKKVLNTKA